MEGQIDQKGPTTGDKFPDYLVSLDSLAQHFRAQLEGLSPTDKGHKFAQFVQRLVPQTEVGARFGRPLLRGKPGDEGVDLTADSEHDRSLLYVQAKLWVDRADDIDSVLSKFQGYIATHHSKLSGQQYQFDAEVDEQPAYFVLVTLSPLAGILKKYKNRGLASKPFYQQCVQERRLHFVDGDQILSVLQAAYMKVNRLPTDVVLNLETPVIRKDKVFFGIISSKELQDLYKKFGDALFFENIRDFLGPAKASERRERKGRTTPNDEIIKTVTDCPGRMLERNNGIVFRADKIRQGDRPSQLILSRGSVVNGCQTTMCLVEYASKPCYVPVKVVETSESWDIAKAANYQTSVADIDLELARFVRPQLAKRAATISGLQVDDGERSAFQIVDAIYDRRVVYDETRLLYIGLFSRTPNNVFAANYTELVHDLIDRFYQDDPYGNNVFETLFALQGVSQEGLKKAEETFTHPSYAAMFQRYYKEDKPSYRCFVSILALCGAVNVNIAERQKDPIAEYKRMTDVLSKARDTLENRKERFSRYYLNAVKVWIQICLDAGGDDTGIRRDMSIESCASNRIPTTGCVKKIGSFSSDRHSGALAVGRGSVGGAYASP